MKKTLAMLLAAAMVLGLVACAAPAATTATEAAPAATEAATTAAATQAATEAATEAAVEVTPAGEKVLKLVRQQSPSNNFDFTMPLQDASNNAPGIVNNLLWLTLK